MTPENMRFQHQHMIDRIALDQPVFPFVKPRKATDERQETLSDFREKPDINYIYEAHWSIPLQWAIFVLRRNCV